MWTDDRYWLGEMLLERRHFVGKFVFDDDTMLTNEVVWLG
jgi:8-oxo-dGTP diphosphatase